MIKVENIETYGWEAAIRGMRNPMNSWANSDSYNLDKEPIKGCGTTFQIGPNDMKLAKSLRNGGSDDRKYLRQIFVSMDITAPLYWWKEMDQYKVSTVTNSCSTMHKLGSRDLTIDDFSHEFLLQDSANCLLDIINKINWYRRLYASEEDPLARKCYWEQMIQLLPSSYNQKRTWTANYEVLINIFHARRTHKLPEWKDMCRAIERMPYGSELILRENEPSMFEKPIFSNSAKTK